MKFILMLALFATTSLRAHDALVWGGPGACSDGCLDAAVHVTKLAGFDPMVVTPENFDPSMFNSAKVWVQPGGKAGRASIAMGPEAREKIKQFIHNGGGYVGFCAGAFITTPKVGSTSVEGLGIIDGKTKPFLRSRQNVSVQPMIVSGKTQWMYWEGGPFFKFTKSQRSKVTVNSLYQKTNQIAGVDTTYGKGRISVIGTHPEAPQWWYDENYIIDQDGLDNETAADMIRWAAKKE